MARCRTSRRKLEEAPSAPSSSARPLEEFTGGAREEPIRPTGRSTEGRIRTCGATSRAGASAACGLGPACSTLIPSRRVTRRPYDFLPASTWTTQGRRRSCFAQGWYGVACRSCTPRALWRGCSTGGSWRADAVLSRDGARQRGHGVAAAIQAVMDGCRPEVFPGRGAAIAASGDPEFTLHGRRRAPAARGSLVIVNGP